MAVELRCFSVIVPIERIDRSRHPHGFEGLRQHVADSLGKTCWHDEHLLCEMAVSPGIVEATCRFWENQGLQPMGFADGRHFWKDLCVIDYYQGLTLPCDWIEVDEREHVAWHAHYSKGATVRGDDTFSQRKTVFLPVKALGGAVIRAVDPERAGEDR